MVLLRRCVLLLALMPVLGLSQAANASKSVIDSNQQVLVSVHPLALLVKSAWPHLTVTSMVPANQSPHDFSLKPSDLAKVHNADSVVWLGAEFEPYLIKLMSRRSQQVDLSLLPSESIEHDEHESHDPHLWLQPDKIPLIIKAIQAELGLSAPKEFLAVYKDWLKSSKQDFEKSRHIGFVSFHDAFHYWVEYFNLTQLDVVTLNPEKPVGTRHVVEVREILASGRASCLFVEPQFQTRLLKKLTQGLSVQQVKIDPMASQYEINQGNFLGFYKNLAQQFMLCLSL